MPDFRVIPSIDDLRQRPGVRAGQTPEQRFGMDVAAAARAAPEVVLERGVSTRHSGDALEGGVRERRPAEVGVNDHAGGIDHGLERRSKRVAKLGRDGRFDARGD